MNDYEKKESNGSSIVCSACSGCTYGLRQRTADERTKEDQSGAQ